MIAGPLTPEFIDTEIGHEKAQSVIDSITSSYAAEGENNPMFQQQQAPGGFGAPPMGAPGQAGKLRNNSGIERSLIFVSRPTTFPWCTYVPRRT